MTDRDFLTDMNTACRTALNESEDPVRLVAEKLTAHLMTADPELLTGWLHLRATFLVAEHMSHMNRADRAATRSQAPRRAFEAARKAFEAGDTAAFGALFRARYKVADDGRELRVADMTGADHLFVSAGYQEDSKEAAFLARVHKAVARKVGDRKTSEVLSEEEYARMFSTQRAGTTSAA